MENNYYINQKKKLMKSFKRIKKSNQSLFEQYYGKSEAIIIANEIEKKFESLIPQIPYIGGKENWTTNALVGSAQVLAVIMILKNRGESREKIGEILFKIMDNIISSLNPILKKLARKMLFSKKRIKQLKKSEITSKEKKYPDDWVLEFVEPHNNSYNYGYNILECGICKFYKKMGYEEYLPYLCLLDYAKYNALNIRLERTKTIGNGDSFCDFRLCKKGSLVDAWPPEKVEEFKLDLK